MLQGLLASIHLMACVYASKQVGWLSTEFEKQSFMIVSLRHSQLGFHDAFHSFWLQDCYQ